MKLTGKITAALLAVALIFAGCAGEDVSWVYKSDSFEIPPGVYIIYQIQSFAEAEQKIAEENSTDPEFSLPKQSALLKMTVEGQPASDWIVAKTREKTLRHIAVRQGFEERGLSLTENELASVESSVGMLKSQAGDFYEKNGVSDASIREIYTNTARESALFTAMYGEGGEYAVSDDELLAYFGEHYAIIDAIPIPRPYAVPEGETKTLEQLEQEAKAEAEEYVRRLKAGEEIEALMYERELNNAAEDEKEHIVKPEKGELRMVLGEANRASFGDELTDAALSAKAGEPQLVEGPGFFAVFYRIDPADDAETFGTYKNALLYEMRSEDFSEKLMAMATNAVVTSAVVENAAAIGRYKPGRLKLESEA